MQFNLKPRLMIQHQGTHQYSSGKALPKFVDDLHGKMWKNRKDIKRHLSLVMRSGEWPYDNCRIVSIDGYHSSPDNNEITDLFSLL